MKSMMMFLLLSFGVAFAQTTDSVSLQKLTDQEKSGKRSCGDYFAVRDENGKPLIAFRTANRLWEAPLDLPPTVTYNPSADPPTAKISNYNPAGSYDPEGIVPHFTMTREQKKESPCLAGAYVTNP